MSELFFALIVVVISAGLRPLVRRPEAAFEFPVFMSLTFAIFVLPQCLSLIRYPGLAVGEPVEQVLLMTLLCSLVCSYGCSRAHFPFVRDRLLLSVDEGRLLLGGFCFFIIATVCDYSISQMSIEDTGGSMWSGRVVIYHFFAQLIFPSFAIFLRHAVRTRSGFSTVLTVCASLPILRASVFAGRREGTFHFLLTIGIVLWCEMRIAPPRWLVIFISLFAMLAIPATGQYRGIAANRDWEKLSEFDLLGNFNRFLNQESILELRNAAIIINGTSRLGAYEYGVAYWDELVWRFVPAQVVGREVKDLLMINRGRTGDILALSGYVVPTGSTVTGMGDAFRQFGYLGCLFFLLPARLFKMLWEVAQTKNGAFAQLVYVGVITSAMRAITHQTVDFLPGLIYQVIFACALYWYARKAVSPRPEYRIDSRSTGSPHRRSRPLGDAP